MPLPSLRTLQWPPPALASRSSYLACQHGPLWSAPAHLSDQMFPHPHHLHSYTQTRDTKPCRSPHTPCCSGCVLLFMPASPTTCIHSPGELHSSFKTVQDAPPPESSRSPQRGMDVLSLSFPHPSNLSHHIVFTFPSALMSGRSLGAGAIPPSSSYAQHRTVD